MTIDVHATGDTDVVRGMLTLLQRQNAQQQRLGEHPLAYEDGRAVEYAHAMQTALVCEAVEFLDEWPWKPWANGGKINADEAMTELVDILKFWMNLALVTAGQKGMGLEELANELVHRYELKTAKVDARAERGSDRQSDRCPDCGRGIDDGRAVSQRGIVGRTDAMLISYLCACEQVNELEVKI